MQFLNAALLATLIVLGTAGYTMASDTGHGHGDGHGEGHGEMNRDAMGASQAEVKGVVNSVDAEGNTINVTHEPVEALGWPGMTMDLPVTRRVDLSTVKPGDEIKMTLKKGMDKTFRITEIEPVE